MKELVEEFKGILTKAFKESVNENETSNIFEEGEESINFFKKTEKEVLDFIFSDKVRDMWNVKITMFRSYSYYKRLSRKIGDSDLIIATTNILHLLNVVIKKKFLMNT